GSGRGGFAGPPRGVVRERPGGRPAASPWGVLVLVTGLPLARAVRRRPEDHGLLPDGATSYAELSDDPDEEEEWGMSTPDALRTSSFWLISLGQASALLVIGALMVHLVIYIHEDLGYSLALAAFAITIQTIGQIVGQLAGAYLGDRWPKRPLIVGALLGHGLAIFLLAIAPVLSLVYLSVAINGAAWGLRAPLQMAIRADYFGRRSFGTIMGFSSLVIMSGMIIGPTFAGIMYDQTGSYRMSFLVLAFFASLGAIFFAFARPPAASLAAQQPAKRPPTPEPAPRPGIAEPAPSPRTLEPATVTHALMGAEPAASPTATR
ncbi:MAG: MFS transporter, partial [Chloroflexi bacterium]|nr:MFS transporter [Chloroflexota bacterium]